MAVIGAWEQLSELLARAGLAAQHLPPDPTSPVDRMAILLERASKLADEGMFVLVHDLAASLGMDVSVQDQSRIHRLEVDLLLDIEPEDVDSLAAIANGITQRLPLGALVVHPSGTVRLRGELISTGLAPDPIRLVDVVTIVDNIVCTVRPALFAYLTGDVELEDLLAAIDGTADPDA